MKLNDFGFGLKGKGWEAIATVDSRQHMSHHDVGRYVVLFFFFFYMFISLGNGNTKSKSCGTLRHKLSFASG